MKKKVTSFILTALLIGALGYVGVTAKAQEVAQQVETLYVNTLIYFDEEYCAQDWSYGSRELIFYHLFEEDPTLDNIHDKFKDYYHIIFVPLNAWRYPENHFETWASDNSKTTRYTLLQDAIKTHGGVWDPTLGGVGEYYMPQRPYWKGSTCYIADLTIFFTGQVEYGGLSPPEWNASILSQVSFVSESNLMHELSHQWWVLHCGGWCCMNTGIQGLVEDWCNNCRNTLNQHREEFGYKRSLNMVEKGGRGYTTPTDGFKYQQLLATTVTIQAFPRTSETYWFYWWKIDSPGSTTFVFTQTYTYTVVDDCTIRCKMPCSADCNLDGHVNVLDAIYLSCCFGQDPLLYPHADIDDDGYINVNDALILQNSWTG